MKRTFVIVVVGLLLITLSGCQKKNITVAPSAPVSVAETGTVIDITEKNNGSVTTRPGDVIYLKLIGEAASGNQWTVISPVSGDFVSLKEHTVVGLTDRNAPNKQFTDEWWIKLEKTGSFELRFDYGRPGAVSKKTFTVSITSQ